jgi:putative methyltransferase (TIGR04325 family)
MPFLAALGIFEGPANVLDFGGGLGMVYFEMARIAPERLRSWKVAELAEVVDYGTRHLADHCLCFEEDFSQEKPDIVITSHALQYLECPYDNLQVLVALKAKVIVLHELSLSTKGPQFAVQNLIPQLGGGRRPIQTLVAAKLAECMVNYKLIAEIELSAWAPLLADTRQVAQLYIYELHS